MPSVQWVVGWTAQRGRAPSLGACGFIKHAHVSWSEGLVLRWFLLPLSGVKLILLKGSSLPVYGCLWVCVCLCFYGPVTSFQLAL